MLTNIAPYINFNGQASEAIEFYRHALGAELEEITRWGDLPPEVGSFDGDAAKRVMYSRISIAGHPICLSDVPTEMTVDLGSAHNVLLNFDHPDDLDRCFAALSDGGNAVMPVHHTFWNAKFGKVIDRFGVAWMLNCELGQA